MNGNFPILGRVGRFDEMMTRRKTFLDGNSIIPHRNVCLIGIFINKKAKIIFLRNAFASIGKI